MDWKKIMPGTKLPQISILVLKYLALTSDHMSENVMWDQPSKMDNFIL